MKDMLRFSLPSGYYLEQKFHVNIMVDAGDGDYDFSLNSVYPCHCGSSKNPIDPKAGIVWLAESQGYSKDVLQENMFTEDSTSLVGFMKSMSEELLNLPSGMSVVTFLVELTLEQLIYLTDLIRLPGVNNDPHNNPDCGYIVISKHTTTGLYDPWNGMGSVWGIKLEKNIPLPIKFIRSALPDGGDGCSIQEVYGADETHGVMAASCSFRLQRMRMLRNTTIATPQRMA